MRSGGFTSIIAAIILAILLIAGGTFFFYFKKAHPPQGETNKPTYMFHSDSRQEKKIAPPTFQIDKTKMYRAILHTSEGDITIELAPQMTPLTVNNFVYLANQHFYDNTIFHRVIKGFMIQGGDPRGDGTGGPGYEFNDEPFTGDYTRGTVAMANAGSNTNGSQFFIMHADYPLPHNYVIFGHVISGMDAVDRIAETPVQPSAAGELSRPVVPTVLKSVEIQAQ